MPAKMEDLYIDGGQVVLEIYTGGSRDIQVGPMIYRWVQRYTGGSRDVQVGPEIYR